MKDGKKMRQIHRRDHHLHHYGIRRGAVGGQEGGDRRKRPAANRLRRYDVPSSTRWSWSAVARNDSSTAWPTTIALTALMVVVVVVVVAAASDAPYAQGNLFVVYDARSGRTSDAHPQRVNLSDLWCQATRDGETRMRIRSARFLQVIPAPVRAHRAHVHANRSHLRFGEAGVGVTPAAAGKYKCEITTAEDKEEGGGAFVTGNLFVYMRPIFNVGGDVAVGGAAVPLRLELVDDANPFRFTAPSIKVTRGDDAALACPAIGYPPPTVTWYRDGQLIDRSNTTKYRQTADSRLHIHDVDDADAGVYRCVAVNRFPLKLDVADHTFSAQLETQLRVSNSLSWLIPLIIIVVTILLLITIIYACAWWKNYKHNEYHVARKEKCLRRATEEQPFHESDVLDSQATPSNNRHNGGHFNEEEDE